MENNMMDLIDLVGQIWDRRGKVLKCAAIGLAVGVVVAISIPRQYLTEIEVAPEGAVGGNPSGGVSALAGMVGVTMGGAGGEGLSQAIYPQIVASTPFLLEFYEMKVAKIDSREQSLLLRDYLATGQKAPWWSWLMAWPGRMVGWIRSIGRENSNIQGDGSGDVQENPYLLPDPKKSFIEALNSTISVINDKERGTIIIAANIQDPLIAAVVADSVMAKLQQYMTEYRTGKARADLEATEKALKDAKQTYLDAETAYAKSLDGNQNLISKLAQVKIEQLNNERDISFSVYQKLASQFEMAKIKLQEDTPIATIIEPARANLIPKSPNKKIIIAAFGFLFGLGYVGAFVSRLLLTKGKEDLVIKD